MNSPGGENICASAAAKRLPYLPEQGAGAFIGLTLFAAIASRRYLGDIFRKAFTGAPDVRDENEPMPYRVACPPDWTR